MIRTPILPTVVKQSDRFEVSDLSVRTHRFHSHGVGARRANVAGWFYLERIAVYVKTAKSS